MRPLMLLLCASMFFVPARADALTIRDLLELSRAGLGDEVLLALIEVDRPVFSIDAETIKSMKAAGVSERVISAAIRSGRSSAPQMEEPALAQSDIAPPAPEPQVIVIDHHDSQPVVREVEVPVAVPVYIPVVQRSRDRDHDGVRDDERVRKDEPRKAEPVYWGWGGKRRPDAWKEPPTQRPRDPR